MEKFDGLVFDGQFIEFTRHQRGCRSGFFICAGFYLTRVAEDKGLITFAHETHELNEKLKIYFLFLVCFVGKILQTFVIGSVEYLTKICLEREIY